MMSYQYKFQDDDQTKIKCSVKYVSADAAFVFLCFAYRCAKHIYMQNTQLYFYMPAYAFLTKRMVILNR